MPTILSFKCPSKLPVGAKDAQNNAKKIAIRALAASVSVISSAKKKMLSWSYFFK